MQNIRIFYPQIKIFCGIIIFGMKFVDKEARNGYNNGVI